MSQVVIIGGGQASLSCSAELRAKGFDGEITILCAEQVPPYQRPPLSKAYLLGKLSLDRLFLRPQHWYLEQRVSLKLGQRAVKLDAERGVIALDTGAELNFDHLVLATGAEPNRLDAEQGGELEGIYYMRSLADADALAPAMTKGKNLLVIGGGYIGLEAAAVARMNGLEVNLAHSGGRVLSRVAGAETAEYVQKMHEDHGVKIHLGKRLLRLEGDRAVEAAIFTDGTRMPVDLAVVGIGVAPETSLAEAAGLTLDGGIHVDEFCQTSKPGIWAVGDCASFTHNGSSLRVESVGNAIDMGELVARNIMGANEPYRPKPWFWSDQYDLKLQISGISTGHDAVVLCEKDGRSHWYFKGPELIAVDALNAPRAYMVGKRLIEAGKTAAPAQLRDPDLPLRDLLRQ